MKTLTTEIQKHDNLSSLLDSPSAGLPQLHQPFGPPAEQSIADKSRASAIESLKRKQRADSFFQSLTDEQQDKLLDWLETERDLGAVLARVSAPAPEGFGLKVHLTSLRRLRAHWRSLDFINRNEEILDTIHDMETNSDFSQSHRIQEAINQLLHEKAFELARTHPGSDVLRDVLASIQRLAELDYKREKLLIERQKLLRLSVGSPQHHRVDLNIVRPAPPLKSVDSSKSQNELPPPV